jgi:glyceraldehyde 3-phosphate dehydrogenase
LTTLENEIYIKNGVKKVIISAPTSDNTPTYIYGANHEEYLGEPIISSSSCSATAIVPIFKIIDENFGIKSAFLSMTHSYTAYQKLLDVKHYSKDIRRTRSATQNIIPLESSAADAVSKFFPHLNDKLCAKSIRVPVSSVTIYDLSIRLNKKSDKLKMQELFTKEVKNRYKDVLDITFSPLVSTDFIKNPHSATIDMNFTDIVGDDLLRVFAWQDNEYGYAKALVNLAKVIE